VKRRNWNRMEDRQERNARQEGNILSRDRLSIDGVWIGDLIY
jgi:hypothetical protein